MLQLRPSSSHIWWKCSAYPRFAQFVPEQPESDPAREGTCAAWLAEMVLTGEVAHPRDLLGESHANGWIITIDMVEFIDNYIQRLRSHGGTIYTERKVTLNRMIQGTPDAYAVLDKEGILRVDDLKYGYMIVEALKNPQVSIYAGAIIRALTARDVKIKMVVIGIYQPRAFHPAGPYRTWSLYPEQLMEFVHELEAAGEACQNPMSVATPGAHCEFCEAAAHCVSLGLTTYRRREILQDDRMATLGPVDLASELEFLDETEKLIKSRRSAIRTEAKARIMKGESVPGWHVEHPKGDRQFKVSAETIQAITGKDPYQERKLKTPAALEREKVSPDVVNALSRRPNRAPVLKPMPADYFQQLFKTKEG